MKRKLIYTVIFILLASTASFSQKIVWKPLSSLPTGYNGEAITLNGKIYFIAVNSDTYAFYMYDPSINKWVELANLPQKRWNLALAEVGGKLYAIGGDSFSNTNFVYTPKTDTWDIATPMPTPRQHIDCGVVNNKIYVMGGLSSWDNFSQKNEVYDFVSNTWFEKTLIPSFRNNPAIVAIDSLIYVIGGADFQTDIWHTIAKVDCYNANTDEWISKSDLPFVLFKPGAVVVNDKIVVLGGQNSNSVLSSVLIYNIENDSWKNTTPLPGKRTFAGYASIKNKIYVIGGSSNYLQSSVYEGELIMEGNFIPALNISLPDTSAMVGERFNYSIPAFSFIDDDTLTYSAKLIDGTNLPDWLDLNENSGKFSGRPVEESTLEIIVTATDNYDASVADTFIISISTTTTIDNSKTERIKVYPNPASQTIQIKGIDLLLNKANYKLTDFNGKTIKQGNLESEAINISELPKGIFMLSLLSNEGIINKKIVIE